MRSQVWPSLKLGDCTTKIGSGVTPRGGHTSYKQTGIPLIRSMNVRMNAFAYEGLAFIDEVQDGAMAGTRVRPGDVLLNITGASIGRVCMVPEEICPANVNQHVCIIRPDGRLLPEWISLYLSHPDFQKRILGEQAGATRQALTKEMIEAFDVPSPQLVLQRRIARRLKEQMVAVEQARQRAMQQAEAASQTLDSLLAEVIDQNRDKSWTVCPLGDALGSRLRTGISKSGGSQSKFRCLGLSAVRNGELDLGASKPIELTDSEAARNRISPGAFYVVRGNGNARLVGRGAIAPPQIDSGLVFPDLLIEVVPNQSVLDVNYLRWAWEAPSVRREIESRSMTTSGIFKINLTNLATVPLPLPPIPKQRQIAARLRDQFSCVRQLQGALTAQLDALEALPGAYLREAFAGLV